MIVKELSIAVDTGDDSYMPKELAVLVGNSEAGLRELKTVMVPRWAMCATRVCSMVHQYSCVDHLFVYIIMYSVCVRVCVCVCVCVCVHHIVVFSVGH